MSDGAQTNPSIDRAEHVDENVSAKRNANYVWDGSNWQRMTQPGASSGLTDTQLRATPVPVSETTGLLPKVYDYMSYTNTNTTTDTYVYKAGGVGGTTVATITIVYSDPTTKAVISTVTRT